MDAWYLNTDLVKGAMPIYNAMSLNTQNDLLMQNLLEFYKNPDYLAKFIGIVGGETHISLRIIDWFVTNYAKKYFTIYELATGTGSSVRFKVYNDYKLKLKAYSKKRFDPFCRWERIQLPYNETDHIETTIGQLNFFKWAIEHQILDYIRDNYSDIEVDMNTRNTNSRRRNHTETSHTSTNSSVDEASTEVSSGAGGGVNNKTRKRREELSVSACKCIKKETVKILVKFS